MKNFYSKSDATFSPCKTYRYTLERWWSPFAIGRYVNFLMLNPSVADAVQSDPTVTRCIGFAQQWGYDGCIVTNIFALRSTNPKALYDAADPVGPDNNEAIQKTAKQADLIVCAWGVHGAFRDRGLEVARMLEASENTLHCLGVTKDGHPRHPLYLWSGTKLELFKVKE